MPGVEDLFTPGNIKRYISKLRLCLPYELSRKIANWMLLDNKKRYNQREIRYVN